MSELVFYTNPMSRGRTVRWMLEEVGQPYRSEVIPFGPPMKTAAYRAINPMGKVPALTHGGTVVTESAAIIAYLADAFPAAALAPAAGSPLRGAYYRWLFFAAGPLEAAATNASLGMSPPPEKRGMLGYGSLADVVDVIEAAVTGRPYVAGSSFTAADLYLAAQLGWLMQFGIVEKRPALVAYVEALQARPARQRAAAIDDELLAKQAAEG